MNNCQLDENGFSLTSDLGTGKKDASISIRPILRGASEQSLKADETLNNIRTVTVIELLSAQALDLFAKLKSAKVAPISYKITQNIFSTWPNTRHFSDGNNSRTYAKNFGEPT